MTTASQSTDLEKLLVSTKFAPPRIGSRYVMREPLLEALARDRHCRLLLVTGSAGFGKTTLLAQWRQKLMAAGSQVAWLSLHPDEKGFSNFRTHMLVALGRLGIPLEDDLLLAEEGPSQVNETVAAVINNVAAMGDELHLMLDDYHHVEDPRAHQLLQKLLDHCPSNLHIAIASRAQPPLSVARLRVMGQVAEVECENLPFSLTETRTFLEQNAAGLKLAAEEVGVIHDQTNGWPASLQLVTIMLKNRPESRATLSSVAWHSSDLQNYLWEDVIGHLPDKMTAFMEALSTCRRFNAALAEAITGRDDATGLIERIEEENLLIMRVDIDEHSAWYRFHPLFLEFLSARLARRGEDYGAALHRRASQWFDKRRLVIEAVRHATLAGDITEAVAIVERAVPGSWKLSYLGPILHLANNVSLDAIAARPRILYLGGLTLAMTGATARAGSWLARLRECPATDADLRAFQTALVEGTIAFQRDDINECLARLDPFRPSDAATAFECYVYLMVRLTALAIAGRAAEVPDLLDSAPFPANDINDDMAMRATGCRAVALLLAGQVRKAETLSTPHHARCVALHGRTSTSASLSAACLATISYELNRIDDARELLASRQTHRQTSSPQMMIWATLCRARLDWLQESAEEALAFLDRQASHFRALGLDRGVAHADAERIRILLATGQVEPARKLSERLQILVDVPVRASFHAEIRILLELALARIELASNRPAAALDHAEAAFAAARVIDRAQLAVTASILASVALDRQGRTGEALARLHRTLDEAADLGLARTFIDEAGALDALLLQMQQTAPLDAASKALLDEVLGPTPAAGGGSAATVTTAVALLPLTAREVEIVGLVAAGMSNKRIALTLQIGVETVKWNLKNIFAKLGVSSRYDAMIWARRQGLIS